MKALQRERKYSFHGHFLQDFGPKKGKKMQRRNDLEERVAKLEEKFRDILEQLRLKDPRRFKEITEAVVGQIEAQRHKRQTHSRRLTISF